MIKAVIFDIDGVLIDSFEANLEYCKNIFQEAGYKAPTRNQYKKMFHLTPEGVYKYAIKDIGGKELKRVMKIGRKAPYPIEKLRLPKNSLEVIRKLFKKYKLGLVTGRMERGVDDYLKFSKTRKYFKVAVHSDHYKNPKPHPEPLLLAAKKLKIKPNEAVYIGDSLTDIQAAKAAGMKMVLYSKKKLKGQDHRVENFKKLLPIIENL